MKKNNYEKYLINDDYENELPSIDDKEEELNKEKKESYIDSLIKNDLNSFINKDQKNQIISVEITKINDDKIDENKIEKDDLDFIEDDFEYIDECETTESEN